MTDELPVGCTEEGCDGIVRLAKSLYEDGGDSLIGLHCPRGHRFDHDKYCCPRCGAEATPADWRPPQVWTGTPPPSRYRHIFNPAKCTSSSCVWEGPK